MTSDATPTPRDTAIDQLEQFGLTTYAARTLVALAKLGSGTAREVSSVSKVPRTRVYDAIDELRERGLVDVQQTTPKEFWAVSAETASRTFEREFDRRSGLLESALGEIESVDRPDEQGGVWTAAGRGAVSERVQEFVSRAEEEIVYMTVEELLTDEVIDSLAAAADRGVSIKLGGVSEASRDRIHAEIPTATTFESLWVWADTSAGRLMMTDRTTTLVSALVEPGTPDPAAREETAIWGRGDTNSLVVVLRAIFAWRLEELDRA